MLARVTRRLAEVASYVGVSEATVSRVLNGKPGISDATRAAVLTALDVIGYERPTHLRVRRARMVGLVLPELQNPIFPALAEVVGGALAQRGFNAVLCTRTGSTSEAEYVEMLLERQVSGMVFAGGQYAEADAPHEHYARLIGRGVTGIVCASDPLALGAIRAARRAGLSVPADISVVGYDDSAFMSCTDPPLTTVRQPIEAIGRAAVAMLTGQIEGAAVSAEELFFEPEIVARGSTAAVPAKLAARA